jgi:hypothetical protein
MSESESKVERVEKTESASESGAAPPVPRAAPVPAAVPSKPIGLLVLQESAAARADWTVPEPGMVHHTDTYRAFGYTPPCELVRSAATGLPYIEKLERLEWLVSGGQLVYALEDGVKRPAQVDLRKSGAKHRGGSFELLYPIARHIGTGGGGGSGSGSGSGSGRVGGGGGKKKRGPLMELVLYDLLEKVVITAAPSSVTSVYIYPAAQPIVSLSSSSSSSSDPPALAPVGYAHTSAARVAADAWQGRVSEGRRVGRCGGAKEHAALAARAVKQELSHPAPATRAAAAAATDVDSNSEDEEQSVAPPPTQPRRAAAAAATGRSSPKPRDRAPKRASHTAKRSRKKKPQQTRDATPQPDTAAVVNQVLAALLQRADRARRDRSRSRSTSRSRSRRSSRHRHRHHSRRHDDTSSSSSSRSPHRRGHRDRSQPQQQQQQQLPVSLPQQQLQPILLCIAPQQMAALPVQSQQQQLVPAPASVHSSPPVSGQPPMQYVTYSR